MSRQKVKKFQYSCRSSAQRNRNCWLGTKTTATTTNILVPSVRLLKKEEWQRNGEEKVYHQNGRKE